MAGGLGLRVALMVAVVAMVAVVTRKPGISPHAQFASVMGVVFESLADVREVFTYGHLPAEMRGAVLKERFERKITLSHWAAPRLWLDWPREVKRERVMAGSVPVFVFTSRKSGFERNARPLLIYIHGGGFTVGRPDGSYDYLARRLAAESGWAVASIDYRLAPEHPFPAGLEDVLEATEWLIAHAGRRGYRRDRVVIAGDSAGGNLATAALQLAKERRKNVLLKQIGLQMLIYPWVDLSCLTCYASQLDYGRWGTIDLHHTARCLQYYVGDERKANTSLVSPVLATPDQLRGLPPAHVITAEFDLLRDEAEVYAGRLRDAGVPTTLKRYDGTVHGFVFFHTSQHAEAIADIVKELERYATKWGWN